MVGGASSNGEQGTQGHGKSGGGADGGFQGQLKLGRGTAQWILGICGFTSVVSTMCGTPGSG